MSKPSEIIKEIENKLISENWVNWAGNSIDLETYREICQDGRYFQQALFKYLDSEYEKNQPCKHEKLVDMLLNGCRYCHDCGVMGYFGMPNKGKQGI
jgi:hypothetical protein